MGIDRLRHTGRAAASLALTAVPLLAVGCTDDTTPSGANTSSLTSTATDSSGPTTYPWDTTTPAAAPAASGSDQQTAADLDRFLHENFGLSPNQPFSDLLGDPSATWAGYISDITVDHRNAHVGMQIDAKNDKELAQRASKAIASLVRLGDAGLASKLSWIIAEDGSGVVVSQTKI
ncbi:hypothetical protein [Nocardia nova]|uniref:hypothetical protein n=1 Tax=Nocardia nova TaxID=37330 RepID=UPI002157B1CC|nr:hypothetical protein [Nocardia nova]